MGAGRMASVVKSYLVEEIVMFAKRWEELVGVCGIWRYCRSSWWGICEDIRPSKV